MKILVSGCLLGLCCRYDGKSKPNEKVIALGKTHELIPVCPEQMGGLPTPRPPCELQDGRVISNIQIDCTKEFTKGAQEAYYIYRLMQCECAILCDKSPSCGSHFVYDGTFSGTLREGQGLTASLLMKEGVDVYAQGDDFPF